MDRIDRIIAVIRDVCHKPQMYVCGGSFYEVCAYISGYAAASPDCDLSGKHGNAFNEFVCATFRFPQKYVWPSVLKHISRDDHDAMTRLHIVLTEFLERTRSEAPEDIARQAMALARSHQEGEPEITWRKFKRAEHRGRRDEIEPLIQEHPDAEILWSSSYPEDVAPLLDAIQDSYLVGRISGSEAEGEVTIATPDFGPVAIKHIGGAWRVDATNVIETRKANHNRTRKQ